MARKITMTKETNSTYAEVFASFITAKTAENVADITIRNYHNNLHTIAKYLDVDIPLEQLTRKHLDEMIVAMRKAGLAHNSITTYVRIVRTFLNWCNEKDMTTLTLPNMKDKDTVKETYSDNELVKLLKKPGRNCDFTEYRNWVIVNFLLNSGCRASTVRNIQNRDVDLDARQITLRHTKNSKIQVIPLCSVMVNILREYIAIRGGEAEQYLFCNQFGEMLTMNALRLAIAKYNRSRGVEKTSTHLYRHTFARKYLVDCGGDAFMLQKLLGHSTLKMTKHYCAIYDSDIAKNFDRFSPLAQMNQPKEKITRR
ncbi:MAG: site-specific integrase [Oscillospiraceae bacterium]|nr:site-specific integrase [Oscillospiraceae bacterium]